MKKAIQKAFIILKMLKLKFKFLKKGRYHATKFIFDFIITSNRADSDFLFFGDKTTAKASQSPQKDD